MTSGVTLNLFASLVLLGRSISPDSKREGKTERVTVAVWKVTVASVQRVHVRGSFLSICLFLCRDGIRLQDGAYEIFTDAELR